MTTVGRITQLSDRALNRLNADMIKNLEGNPMTVMRCAIHQRNHTVFEPCQDCRLEDDEKVREAVVPEDRRKADDFESRYLRRKSSNEVGRLIQLATFLSYAVHNGDMESAKVIAAAYDKKLSEGQEGK